MSIWSLLVLLPSYTVLHDVKFSAVLVSIKMSELDKLTIADSLQNRDVVVLALCMTFLYTAFAFFAIVVQLSLKMMELEFPAQYPYIESFIQQHSLVIRGVNKAIGVEECNYLIRKFFEEKYDAKQIIAVHTVRLTEKAHELALKREYYTKRLDQINIQNSYHEGKRETVSVGRFFAKKIDAEAHYREKLKKAEVDWVELKARQLRENAGVAFVSFRDKSCVAESMEELAITKVRYEDSEVPDKLGIESWEFEEAMPKSDIIWSEINQGQPLNTV